MIDVVYDACVLYSASLRDLLLNLASAKVVYPHWSNEIHDEWIRNLMHNRPDLKRESLERTRQMMDTKFRNGLVEGYDEIIPSLDLPDPNDRHVLAVAIRTKSPWIVTFNLDDFPKTLLAPHEVEAISPDEFIGRLAETDLEGVLFAFARHRANLTRPAKTVDEYLATLEKQRLPKTVAFLKDHRSEI